MNISLKQSAVRGIRWNMVNTAVQTIVQLIQFAATGTYLSPKDFGLVGLAVVFSGFVSIIQDMGFSSAVIRNRSLNQEQLSTVYWINVFSSIVLSTFFVGAAFEIARIYSAPELKLLLYITAANITLSSVGLQFVSILEREMQFKALMKIDSAASILGTGAVIYLASRGYGAVSIILGQSIFLVARTIFLWSVGFTHWHPSLVFKYSSIGEIRQFGWYQVCERIVNYLNFRCDQLILGKILGPVPLGFYSFSFNLVWKITEKVNPNFIRVAYPILSRLQEDKPKTTSTYLKLVYTISVINAILHMLLFVVAPDALTLALKGKWLPSLEIIQLLCIAFALRSTLNPVGAIVLAAGKAKLSFKWNVGLLLIMPGIVFASAYFWGGVGVAWGMIIIYTIMQLPAYLILIKPLINSSIKEYFHHSLSPFLFAFICALASVSSTAMLTPGILRLVIRCVSFLGSTGLVFMVLDRKRVLGILKNAVE